MNDLGSLMQTATDRLEAPHLVPAALEESRRRRRRHRTLVAVGSSALVAVVAVAAVGVTGLGGRDDAPSPQDPVVGPTAPSPSDASPPDVPSSGPSGTPSRTGPATQPLWDPFDVPGLPRRETLLPARLDPPAGALPTFAERPAARVLLAWPEEGRDLRILGADSGWRTVPGTADVVGPALRPVVRPAISGDGTRVAYATVDGVAVLDVTAGTTLTLPWPAEIDAPWDTPPDLLWRAGDEDLVVLHWRRPWVMGLDGSDGPAPYPGRFVALAVDPAGPVVQNDYERRRLLTWDDDRVVGDAPFAQCERLAAAHGLVACTAGSLEPFRSGPVVVDTGTGEIVAYAPIRDRNSVYSDNAHLTVRGFLDERTVLLDVGPADFGVERNGEGAWHLVAWELDTGRFELVATAGEGLRTAPVLTGAID